MLREVDGEADAALIEPTGEVEQKLPSRACERQLSKLFENDQLEPRQRAARSRPGGIETATKPMSRQRGRIEKPVASHWPFRCGKQHPIECRLTFYNAESAGRPISLATSVAGNGR